MNFKNFRKWDYVSLTCQTILLILALMFVSQQKYFQAITLLILSGGIGSARNANSVIKLFNRINLGLAALIFLYWLYLKVIGI